MNTTMNTTAARTAAQRIAARYTHATAAQNDHMAAAALAQYGRLVERLGFDPLG